MLIEESYLSNDDIVQQVSSQNNKVHTIGPIDTYRHSQSQVISVKHAGTG